MREPLVRWRVVRACTVINERRLGAEYWILDLGIDDVAEAVAAADPTDQNDAMGEFRMRIA
jgi:hypothetical protein